MGLGDILFGKSKTYSADPLAGTINQAGKQGIGIMTDAANQLNKRVYGRPDEYIQNQIGMENKAMRGGLADVLRRSDQMIAQRGLQNSSIGLGNQVNQERTTNNAIAMNNASTGSRLKDLLREQMGLGQSLYGVKAGAAGSGIQMQNVTGPRQGGIAPLLGAGLGAYLGGKSGNAVGGAQVGMGLGQYMSQ